jgi:hypothetical protein
MAVGAPEGLGTTKVSVRLGGGVNFLLPREHCMKPPIVKRLTSAAVLSFSMFGVVDSHAGYREECSSDIDQ